MSRSQLAPNKPRKDRCADFTEPILSISSGRTRTVRETASGGVTYQHLSLGLVAVVVPGEWRWVKKLVETEEVAFTAEIQMRSPFLIAPLIGCRNRTSDAFRSSLLCANERDDERRRRDGRRRTSRRAARARYSSLGCGREGEKVRGKCGERRERRKIEVSQILLFSPSTSNARKVSDRSSGGLSHRPRSQIESAQRVKWTLSGLHTVESQSSDPFTEANYILLLKTCIYCIVRGAALHICFHMSRRRSAERGDSEVARVRQSSRRGKPRSQPSGIVHCTDQYSTVPRAKTAQTILIEARRYTSSLSCSRRQCHELVFVSERHRVFARASVGL